MGAAHEHVSGDYFLFLVMWVGGKPHSRKPAPPRRASARHLTEDPPYPVRHARRSACVVIVMPQEH